MSTVRCVKCNFSNMMLLTPHDGSTWCSRDDGARECVSGDVWCVKCNCGTIMLLRSRDAGAGDGRWSEHALPASGARRDQRISRSAKWSRNSSWRNVAAGSSRPKWPACMNTIEASMLMPDRVIRSSCRRLG
jgi:hypothetical protein